MEHNEEAEAEGDDEEAVPGEEEEEGLQHTQEHRHVDVALSQLWVHSHLILQQKNVFFILSELLTIQDPVARNLRN
jgi:hypothetical protein